MLEPKAGETKINAEIEEVNEKVKALAEAAVEKKAEDIVMLDVTDLTGYTDRLLLCSGSNKKQIQAIADEVVLRLKKNYSQPLGTEGYGEGTWILIDADDVVVHVFERDTRSFYDLENLWHDAPRLAVDP